MTINGMLTMPERQNAQDRVRMSTTPAGSMMSTNFCRMPSLCQKMIASPMFKYLRIEDLDCEK
ncbi:hypothetical protein [Sedimentimonas flavescens]|uniref:hypothetical protein n=1 Tax=Sedimentimonas flavescens TaxID=2851012 RepID=UPI001C4A21A2|nr:hypothetical protein [Sedimentimonas flavescens]MBW0159449.1 hypothetical protein [Sedimentimonas flavescens]